VPNQNEIRIRMSHTLLGIKDQNGSYARSYLSCGTSRPLGCIVTGGEGSEWIVC
jgi:hypothetical protein